MLIFAILALLSEIVGTIGGFGSSVFFVPLAGLFFDFKTVLAITGIFHVFSNVSKLIIFKRGIDKNLLLYFGIPSIIAVLVGAWLSKFISGSEWITDISLGIFLVIFSVILLIFKNIQIKPKKTTAVSMGGLAGFLAGIIGTGGVVRGLALSSFNLEKSAFIMTSAAIDLGVDLSRTVVYISSGYFSTEYWKLVLVLLVVSYLGSWIGNKIVEKIPQERFRSIVLVLILGIGLYLIFKGWKV